MTGRGGQSFAVLAVRAIHTAVFLVELASIAWLLISGMLSRRDRSVGFAAAAVAAESIVFCANDGVCPLTPLAERLGSAHGQVSDLFLPDRVARTIPIWSSALIVLAILLHARVPISRCVTPDRQCGAGRESVFRH
jgi:hypothetical protein